MKYKYVNSNIPWVGSFPEHWKLERIKSRTENVVGGEWGSDPDSDDSDSVKNINVIRVQDFNNITVNLNELTVRKVKRTKIPHRLIDEGCLMIEKSGGGEKQLVGRVVHPKGIIEESICSNFIAKLSFDKTVDVRFLNYVFNSLYNGNLNYPFIQQTTGIQNINTTYYLYTKVPFPNKIEQIAIAEFLDKTCENIDQVVSIKQKQISQIELMLFSFIDEIFDSKHLKSIEWKEDRIKDIAELNPSIEERLIPTTLVSVIPMEAVSDFGEIDNTNKTQYSDLIKGLNYFRNGDVLFAKITPCMENGKGAFVNNLETEVAFGSTEYFVVRPSKKVLGEYIYYFTRSVRFRKEAEANMKGAAGQQRVTSKYFSNTKIRFPKSIDQQQEIVDKIKIFKAKNFETLRILNTQIDTILKYKKSLIHEVITGKKQVYGLT